VIFRRHFYMLAEVMKILSGSGISQERVLELYGIITNSSRFAARLQSEYLAIAVILIHRYLQNPKGVYLYIGPDTIEYAPGKCSVTVAVVALQWSGLLNSCTGVLHEKGFDITSCETLTVDVAREKLGLVFMEIDVDVPEEFESFLKLEPEIERALIRTAAQETGKRELLMSETQRAEQYALVVEELKKIADPQDYEKLFEEEKGEVVRFFLARTMAYLNDRSPKDLARQIYANQAFHKSVKETGKVCASVDNIETAGGELTAISVAGLEHDLSMGDCFRVIDEVAPGYQWKYDKAYITGDAVNVIRIEIVDARGQALTKDQCTELTRKLTGIRDAPVCDRLSPGVELIGRKICPILLEEEKKLALPQVYMHPHSRSNIKVVVVSSGSDRGHAFDLVESISKIKGLKASMPDPISTVAGYSKDAVMTQEIASVDVWVDFETFFGTPKGPYNDELILVRIEEAIRKTDTIGPRLRIFDRTGRTLRAQRSDRIADKAVEKGLSPEVARQIMSRLGDKLVVSPTTSDDEVFASVLPGIEAVTEWKSSGEVQPSIKSSTRKNSRGEIYSVFAIAHSPLERCSSEFISQVSDLGLETVSVVDGDTYSLLILRFAHRGRGVRDLETGQIERMCRMAFEKGAAQILPGSSPKQDLVNCTVFSPARVPAGMIFMVQVWAHLLPQEKRVEKMARAYDGSARRRGSGTLTEMVSRGSTLKYHLVMPGLEIDDDVKNTIWQGEPVPVQFRVKVPDDYPGTEVFGTVTVSSDTVPIGQIVFKVEVGKTSRVENVIPRATGEATSFEVYFISYASEDRKEVIKRVGMLRVMGKRFFVDLLEFDPGDRWKRELYKLIDDSDAVLLFWSTNARDSEWVIKECLYAKDTKGIDRIIPVIIEGPPPVEPPEELADLHFNDKLLYLMS
jgi:hypothetical protein